MDTNQDNSGVTKRSPAPPGTREFTFPLMDGAAVLRIPHPMGQTNFNLLKAMLDAAQQALVGAPDKPANPG